MVSEINDLRAGFSQKYWLSFLTSATLATLLVSIPIGSAWRLFLGLPYSPHVKHLFVCLLLPELIAMAVLITEYVGMRRFLAQAKTAREQLRLAMSSGNSAAWEWDPESGGDHLFGDLPSMLASRAMRGSETSRTSFATYIRTIDSVSHMRLRLCAINIRRTTKKFVSFG